MAYLVRKFHRPLWQPGEEPPKKVDDVCADVFSKCLQTKENSLSLWKSDSPVWGEFNDVLAAMFSTLNGPGRTDIVLIEEEKVEEIAGVVLEEVLGESKANEETNQKHRDLSNLKIGSSTELADLILDELAKGKQGLYRRYAKDDMLEVVNDAVEREFLDESELCDRWRRKLSDFRVKKSGS